MSDDFALRDYVGVLDDSTADDLERRIGGRRTARNERYRARIERIAALLSE